MKLTTHQTTLKVLILVYNSHRKGELQRHMCSVYQIILSLSSFYFYCPSAIRYTTAHDISLLKTRRLVDKTSDIHIRHAV